MIGILRTATIMVIRFQQAWATDITLQCLYRVDQDSRSEVGERWDLIVMLLCSRPLTALTYKDF